MNPWPNKKNAMKIKSQWVVFFEKGKRYMVSVGQTGFRSTAALHRATRFETREDLERFAAERGLFVFRAILVHFDA